MVCVQIYASRFSVKFAVYFSLHDTWPSDLKYYYGTDKHSMKIHIALHISLIYTQSLTLLMRSPV